MFTSAIHGICLSLRRSAIAVLLLTTSSTFLHAGCTPKRVAASAIPAYAWDTLDCVRSHNQAPDGFVGGRYFGNYGSNGETKLPMEFRGRRVTYREWDVHRQVPRRNRGAERLITGNDGRAWYTADHYCSFTEMK